MMNGKKVLVVEDNHHEIENLSGILKIIGAQFSVVTTVKSAIDTIEQKAFDFLLTDLHIETKAGHDKPDGIEIINYARECQPRITIVANSSDPRTEIWNMALQAGAHHFIRKPVSKADEIVIAFELALDRNRFIVEASRVSKPKKASGQWKKYADGYPYGVVISERHLKIARGIARTKDATFVIMGETGTGKEEIAKLIHRFRTEMEGRPVPFVAVNCATINGTLAESQLFGHRKGAFTGADQSTIGFIGEADGGILFLDEIHALDIPTQQKLLRVLNDGTYNRLGETKTYTSRFQLLAASTRDIDEEVDAGRLLLDIRSRMMGLDLRLPPLRERVEDIPAFISLFLSKKNIEVDDRIFLELVDKLKRFRWSGNVRQLFKALEAWILTCEFEELPLIVEHFPIFKGMMADREITSITLPDPGENHFIRALREDTDLDITVSEFEKAVIVEAVKRHKTLGECCRALNLNRSTFDAKRRKYGLL